MTDKKFTDEEIIKAIGNLFKNTDGIYELTIQKSTKGVYGEKQYYCIPEGVYNLIMRQSSFIDRQKTEIERLNKKVEELSDVLSSTIKIRYTEAKAEAYEEFAEKLKKQKRLFHYLGLGKTDYAIAVKVSTIDNILKEMVGEKE